MIDLLGHIGYLLLFLGQAGVSRKLTSGWVVRFIGELIWICLGVALGLTSCVVWGLLFAGLDVRSFLAWRSEVIENRPSTS